ncbi:MAG: N-acetylglucosamine-6-phosphate deacetylase [Verrucomicrobiales bacterium]|nr:N-acetylglucosamine-6-phosphate deacetylase [Verrucomicrobiales bacterium]
MLDLQVNGYAGVDFNTDTLTPENLHTACLALREDGVTGFLPTVITASLDAMQRRLENLVEFRASDPLAQQLISGFHIEGPFINETRGYVGAHPIEHVTPATPDNAQRLVDAAAGLAKIVTLAPERDPDMATTRHLADQGIVVAAGHCNPDLDQLHASIDAGLKLFTHLGNGCPAEIHRHDNIINRVLSFSDQLHISLIPDGTHIPFFALKNLLAVIPPERAIFVSDAISAARLGPGIYTLGHWTLDIGDDLVARSPDGSHFVGSTITLPRMKSETQPALNLSDADLSRLTLTNPTNLLNS